MNCPIKSEETVDLLLDYCARKLDPQTVAILDRHMVHCEECARFRDAQQAVWAALDSWDPEPVSLDFNRRLYARIDAAARAPWYRRLLDSFEPMVLRPAFPLAGIAVLVAAGFMFDHPRGSAPAASPNTVSANEAEQVERTLDDLQMLLKLEPPAAAPDKSSRSM